MDKDLCNTCAHYHQHYVLDKRRIFRVNYGHCTFPKVKTKPPQSKKCKNYVPAEPDEAAFVSKEYLSKLLLEYVLNLDLLPPIYNSEE